MKLHLALVAAGLLFSQSAQPAKGKTTYLCETEFSEQQKSKIVVHAESGQTLFVCGRVIKAKGFNEISAFKVFVIGKSGKKLPGVAFEDTGQKVYRVTNTVNSLTLQELISDGKSKIPAYEIEIRCDEKSCHRQETKCAFQPPKGASMKALNQVQAFSSGAKKGKVPPASLIHAMARLAYAGNAETLKFFQERGNLSLDGEASDAYFDHQAMLKKLKKDNCLPSS